MTPRPDPVPRRPSGKEWLEVRVGQLWADNDRREVRDGRRQRLRVIGIDRTTLPDKPLVHLNNEETGKDTWVLLRRMRPNSTGYRLLQESEAADG